MTKGAGRSKAVVLGRNKNGPQKRIGRPSDWTAAMADKFVETLAETCNVTLATQAIGRSIGNVYKWRTKDASFRAAWDRALAVGYSRLEMMLLERALHGVEKVVVGKDGTSSTMREYPDRVALTLLRMHRETAAIADESMDGREHEEACARIIARLNRLKVREDGDAAASGSDEDKAGDAPGAPGVETKTAGVRRAKVRSALTRAAVIRAGLQARRSTARGVPGR